VAALAAAPAYLLLDFSGVRGLDATGARTMGTLYAELAQQGVTLVLAGASHHKMRPLLAAHGLPLSPAPYRWPPELAGPGSAGEGLKPLSGLILVFKLRTNSKVRGGC
jgi:SulP family sulfate permease